MKTTLPFLFSLYRANAVMTRRLSGHGLDFNDLMVIYYLNEAEKKQLRRIDLAHKLGLTASGATRLLLPLEKLRIVKRADSEADNRARLAVLTPAGEELLRDALATLEMRLEDAISGDAKKMLPSFTEKLDEITENLLEPEYKAEAKVRWGDTDAYKQSQEKTKKMSKAEVEEMKKSTDKLNQELAKSMSKPIEHADVQRLVKKHYEGICFFYDCSLEMYSNLGNMYINDPRFKDYYDKYASGLAEFLNKAIQYFCKHNEK
ncbi:MAG: TipAS antibiotic-recognition domain-containing protein [Patescibacteria group bacterium]|nr:TipAS antibiotic-recognition domain-containing protein [Patescibacteria group bacterium]MDD4610465.1 TipAS antibiotic-recognition domain-containing protein [Patescibacteria group bacterium]